MIKKAWVISSICILSLAIFESCCDSRHDNSSGNGLVYKELILQLPGFATPGDAEPIDRPYYVNGMVVFFQNNPLELADFSVAKANELSEMRSTMNVLHSIHLLNSTSAGGYGPPVSGAGKWKRNHKSSEDILADIQRFTASPDDGGVGLRVHPNTLSVLKGMDREVIHLVADLLELASVLQKITSGFADQNLYAELKNSDPSYSTIGPAELLTMPFRERELYSNLHRKFFGSLNPEMIAFGSRIMVEEINSITGRYRELSQSGKIDFDRPIVLETAYGPIEFLTDRQDTVRLPALITLDPGGDDFYTGIVSSETNVHPVAICIDLGGDDTYGNEELNNVIGNSVLGLSYILDMQGNDTYRSGAGGLAFAVMGCAVLDDRVGDDRYICYGNYGIGAAFFGQALLIDHKGDDEYRAGSYSSGFAGTGGVALLLDNEGDDKYISPSSSFTQGSSSGRWADATDGFSMGGGVGILLDRRGNDEYSAARFSQGASYFYGLGILADMEGDDSYNSLTHSQGSAVHTSLALFSDLSGNDRYNVKADSARITQSIGYGRDRSYAFFIDQAGDDMFRFGNKSFGVGDIQSIGVAFDFSGNDSYAWYNNTVYKGSGSFGSSQSLDKAMDIQSGSPWSHGRGCAGIAYDMKGNDRYLFFSDRPEPARFFRDKKSDKIITGSTYSLRRDR